MTVGTLKQLFGKKTVHMRVQEMRLSNLGHVFRFSNRKIITFFFVGLCNLQSQWIMMPEGNMLSSVDSCRDLKDSVSDDWFINAQLAITSRNAHTNSNSSFIIFCWWQMRFKNSNGYHLYIKPLIEYNFKILLWEFWSWIYQGCISLVFYSLICSGLFMERLVMTLDFHPISSWSTLVIMQFCRSNYKN